MQMRDQTTARTVNTDYDVVLIRGEDLLDVIVMSMFEKSDNFFNFWRMWMK